MEFRGDYRDHFGATRDEYGDVNGVSAGTASSWSATSIGVTVPRGSDDRNVVVK